jgi:hypothetical protein
MFFVRPPLARGGTHHERIETMPEKKTIERARKDLAQGKSASTAAGEFVHEEIEHVREGKHGARSPQQAIAIGLSKARRAGIPLAAPQAGQTSESTRRSAARDSEVGQGTRKRRPSKKRSRATTRALKREPRASASKAALSRQAKAAATRRRRTKKAATSSSAAPRARRSTTRRPRATKATSTRRSRQHATA